MTNVARRLADGWVVTDGNRPLFGADPGRAGIATPVLPDRQTAESLAAIVADGDSAWVARLGVAPLGDPWAAMRAFAPRGVVGLSPQGRWGGAPPPSVRFVVRRHEVGTAVPTTLAAGDAESGWRPVVPDGHDQIDGSDVVPWVRHDVTDVAAITFRDGMPLGLAEHGAPLFEVRAAGRVVVVRDDPLLGPWGDATGVVQLHADAGAAHDRCEALAARLGAAHGPYEVAAVPDLTRWLAELEAERPGVGVTVNPDGHREHAAIAYASPPAEGAPRWWRDRPSLAGPVLRGPGGIWRIGRQNGFEFVGHAPAWSGVDTMFWDGRGHGVAPRVGRSGVTAAWWDVSDGPRSVTESLWPNVAACLEGVATHLASRAASSATAAVIATLRAAGASDSPTDLDLMVRHINLSGVGIVVEGILEDDPSTHGGPA